MIARKRNLLFHSFVILSTVLGGAASRPQKYLRSLSATCNAQSNSPNSCWARNNGGSDVCMYCSNDELCLDLNATRVDQDPSCTTADPCKPQTANGSGFCRAFFGYKWDGSQCSPVEGCSCQGPDCDSLHLNFYECETAYQSCMATPEPSQAPTPEPTPAQPDPCTHQNAIGSGWCRLIFGYGWDGQQCSLVAGCTCLGPDCGSLHPDLSACQAAVQSCIPNSGPTPAPDPDIIGLVELGPGH